MSVIALLVIANVAHTEPKGYHTFDDEYYASKSIAAKGIRTTTREEYAPRDATKPLAYSTAKLVGPAGQLEVTAQYLESARQEFEVRARTTTRAEFGTLAYPGWRATIDGDAAPLSTVPGRGTQSIEIPPGKHTVVLELHPTPVRRWSAVLSFIAMLGAGAPLALLQLRARHAAKLTTGNQDLSCTENIPATRSGIFVSGGPSVVSTGSRASAKDARRSRKSRAL
jgi:hypothetical protein